MSALWPLLPLLACNGGTTSDSGSATDSGGTGTTGTTGTDCLQTWYADDDDDGYGGTRTTESCDHPGDGWVSNDRDCADNDPNTFPGAADDTCDDWDQDCDDAVDEDAGDAVTLYLDDDQDGFGDPGASIESCEDDLPGYSDNAKDCDDSEPGVNPGVAEVCGDGIDNDCEDDAAVCRRTGTTAHDAGDGHLQGVEQYDFLGSAFSGVGDLDGDGHDDFAVGGKGDPYYWANGSDRGVLVSYGPHDPSATLTSLVELQSGGEARLAGAALADVGDLDGDGLDDLVMGAPSWLWGSDFGVVFFHSGPVKAGESLNDCCAALIGDAQDYGSTGLSLDGGSDLTGDGQPDVAIGAPLTAATGRYTDGVVHLVSGMLPGDRGAGEFISLRGESDTNSMFGQHLADLGDTDGDGFGDLLVGASQDYTNDYRGRAYLFLGPIDGDRDAVDADAIIEGPYESMYLGHDVAAAGDLSGDGYRDLLVGGFGCLDTACNYEGSVLVIEGPVDGSQPFATKAATIRGDDRYDQLGWSVDGDFDFDGDDNPDLLVGAPYADDPVTGDQDAGAAYLFYGPVAGSVDAADADFRVNGSTEWAYGAWHVRSLGDLDGDGIDSFGVGVPAVNTSPDSDYLGAIGVFDGWGQ